MAYSRKPNLLFLFFCLICAAQVLQGVQGFRKQAILRHPHKLYPVSISETVQGTSKGWKNRNVRTSMIGSVKPTCTYNECRGCRYKCRAEQVPVEGNDPINSAYHYKCVCHR